MGNRAIVVFKDGTEYSQAVYLHWNGGAESVMAFVHEMQRRNWIRTDYAAARFCQVVGEYFTGIEESEYPDDGLSLGTYDAPKNAEELEAMSPGDNGVFVVSLVNGKYKVAQNGKAIVSLDAVFKRAAKGLRKGFENRPRETYEGIGKFFLDLDALRKNKWKVAA